jgi:acyl-protein synthetase LuxE
LLGTAFLFVHLLDQMQKRGHTFLLPPGSWIMETGGYKGRSREIPKEELHRLLAARLGIPANRIFGEYGMSELSSQAYAGTDGVLRFPPWARALIVSPATGREAPEGERGLIRVCDLANVWSVMAVQTEDIGVKVGDAFRLVGRADRAEARGCSLMTV